MLDTETIEAITFDSFTTIVDVGTSTRRTLADHVDEPDPIARLWRYRAVDYRMVSTFTGVYETYEQTTREALEYALLTHGVSLPDSDIDEIATVFHDLDVFEDVRPGMRRLADAGYTLVVLSNGNPAVLESMTRKAGISDIVETVVSADEIRVYKPDPRIYIHAAAQIDQPLRHIAHVATPWYDVYGAIHAGMQGVWMNRNNAPWDRFNGTPDLIVSGFEELSAHLIG